MGFNDIIMSGAIFFGVLAVLYLLIYSVVVTWKIDKDNRKISEIARRNGYGG